MDLLRAMKSNRENAPYVKDPTPAPKSGRKRPSKAQRAKEHTPGSRSMRQFIIAEKPTAKIVKEHFDALIEVECETSSEEE